MSELVPYPELPTPYRRAATHSGLVGDTDVYVTMRDGVRICIDVYRPETDEPLPALLAFSIYNKELLTPEASALPAQPAWSPLWMGPTEAGDSRFITSRGYVHVVGMPRGVGKSEGGGSREFDSYDLIEWIAAQPWCDGSVGMIGISGFGAEQLHVARQNPPALKAVFPYDPRGAYGTLGGFREEHPGGVLSLFRYLVGHFGVFHQDKGAPGELTPAREALWREAMANPDYRMYGHLLNVLSMKGQHLPAIFDMLLDPYEQPGTVERSEAEFTKIRIPVYTGAGWYGYTYKTHLQGAQSYWRNLSNIPKKLLFLGHAHLERPFHGLHHEIVRWYDHWLKGIDTGLLDEPPVRYWVSGLNAWRTGTDWPLPETQWTKLYLTSWERLRSQEFTPGSADDLIPPDSFVQMPLTHTREVAGLRFMTDPLPHDVLIAGPSTLKLWASIDQDDTNWIVVLKDVGPDPSVRTARPGELDIPSGLPERELARGWLKASNRALDTERRTPWKPFHRLTRDAAEPVTQQEIVEYDIEILSTANLFRAGHRICVEITSMDRPTGVAGATDVEYVPYHVCSSRTTLHHVFHSTDYPSHLLLPLIPEQPHARENQEAGAENG